MATPEGTPQEPSPPKAPLRDPIYKEAACPVAKNAEDMAATSSIIAEFAAGCAGALAKGMQVFSENLGGERERSVKEKFVNATTESTIAVLNELTHVVRRHRARIITPESD